MIIYILKLYVISAFINILAFTIEDKVYDEKKGMTVRDLLFLIGIILTGPICNIFILWNLWNRRDEFLDIYIIKPKTNDVKSGSDMGPPPLLQKS